MIEVTEHEAYKLLTTKYPRVCLDYVILLEDGKYAGLESHKQAVLEAFKILNERFAAYDYQVDVKADKIQGIPIPADTLLQSPPKDYGQRKLRGNRSFNIPTPLPYWFAFLEPPQGTPYLEADFVAFNNVLFPNNNDLEIYREYYAL